MVDVSHKQATPRVARAQAIVRMDPAVRELALGGGLPKGEVRATARLAGIQAAKDAARLIPLCHPLPLSFVDVELEPLAADGILVQAQARTTFATGVEMEAMTAVAVAALCVYDMVKGACRDARIETVELTHKSGGKSGVWDRAPAAAAVSPPARPGRRRPRRAPR